MNINWRSVEMAKWYEGLDKKSTSELKQLDYELCLRADEAIHELSDDSDSDNSPRWNDVALWDRVIDRIFAILSSRRICPKCGTPEPWLLGGGGTPAVYQCQQCRHVCSVNAVAYREQ